ncbi:hypothetical protein B0O95_104163 [Mycetohabitans endofungorum]|uniref:F-box domain-containing protein n=3 Tax=Burkholderiaceae TaxID=119060 RepID=A0A2P5KBZ7_9BURK|nr:hypothetical protein B0O95_104163 [Mycetohabitans endofungorum]
MMHWAANRTSRPTTYHDLPPEIIQQLADHVPFDNIGNLSTVDRRTYRALQERRLSWLCCRRASYAREMDLASMQQLFAEIERIHAEPTLRVEPLDALWPRVSDLPEEQQLAAFQRFFEAAGRVPRQGLQIQKDMIQSILNFPDRLQRPLYEFAYANAERRSREQGSTWAAVASLLRCSLTSASRYESEYQAFLGRLPMLDVAGQADLLVELAMLLPGIRRGEHADAKIIEYYRTLQQWVQRLPASHRGAAIGMLANVIWALPVEHRAVHYAELRHLTLSLPDHQLGDALRYLPSALAVLPIEQQAHELSLLEPAIERALSEQRILVALGLLEGTVKLNEALSSQLWQRGLRLLDGGDETDVLLVLEEIDDRFTPFLPVQQWENAKNAILAFVERNPLSEGARAELLEYLEE